MHSALKFVNPKIIMTNIDTVSRSWINLSYSNPYPKIYVTYLTITHYDWQWTLGLIFTLEQRARAPISEYRSVVSANCSMMMAHKWWSNECLCTVSLTSGIFAKYSILNPLACNDKEHILRKAWTRRSKDNAYIAARTQDTYLSTI